MIEIELFLSKLPLIKGAVHLFSFWSTADLPLSRFDPSELLMWGGEAALRKFPGAATAVLKTFGESGLAKSPGGYRKADANTLAAQVARELAAFMDNLPAFSVIPARRSLPRILKWADGNDVDWHHKDRDNPQKDALSIRLQQRQNTYFSSPS